MTAVEVRAAITSAAGERRGPGQQSCAAAPAAPAGRTRPRLTKDQRSLLARGSRDNTTVATYTVFFYYTREFARDTPDIDRFIDEVLDKTNRGYQQVGQQ